MSTALIDELKSLPVSERLDLVELLWDSIAADSDSICRPGGKLFASKSPFSSSCLSQQRSFSECLSVVFHTEMFSAVPPVTRKVSDN